MLNITIDSVTQIVTSDIFVDILALSASCGVAILCKYLFTFRG